MMAEKQDKRTQDFQNTVRGERTEQLKVDLNRLKTALAAKNSQYADLQATYDQYIQENKFVEELAERFIEPEVIEPIEADGKSESLAAAFAADWHAFETVLPEQVSGINKYNPEICKQSVENYFRTVVKWIDIHRAGTKINKLLLGFLGDLLSGFLWEDQIEMNAGPPLEETLFVTDLVIGGIEHILEHSGCKEIIICACDGNHSRTTKFKRKAQRAKHSLEWLMFHFIRKYFEDKGETRLKWNIAEGYHLYIPIEFGEGKILRLHHGDEGMSYQGGIGGLAVPAQRVIKQWNKGRHADLDIFGHWHISQFPGAYVSVGSLIGYSPVSITYRVEAEPPQQTFMLFEKKKFVTAYHPIYVR